MQNLSAILLAEDKRSKLIDEFSDLVERTVAAKSGFRGGVIKTGFAMVKGLKTGFVPKAVNKLLPDFITALEPRYAQWLGTAKAQSFGTHLAKEKNAVAADLIEVTDRRVADASGLIQKTYGKLRSGAQTEVEMATPAIGHILDQFITHTVKA